MKKIYKEPRDFLFKNAKLISPDKHSKNKIIRIVLKLKKEIRIKLISISAIIIISYFINDILYYKVKTI